MNLSSIVNQISQTLNTQGTAVSSSQLEQELANGMTVLLSKNSGQTITGEVMLLNGADLLLSIGKNQLIQAKLEGNVMPQIGQTMTFQIQNNGSNKVALTPLFENLNQNPNVLNAIKAANLPLTESVIRMVQGMMEEGMPIDKQSLFQMNRLMNQYEGTKIETLIQMQKLDLPVTEENIVQFQNYQNYEHQMTKGFADIAGSFTDSIEGLYQNQGVEDTLVFIKNVVEFLDQLEQKAKTPVQNNTETPDAVVAQEKGTTVWKDTATPIAGRQMIKELLLSLEQAESPEAERKIIHSLADKKMDTALLRELRNNFFLEPADVAKEDAVETLYRKLNEEMRQLSSSLNKNMQDTATPFAKSVNNLVQNVDFMNQLNQTLTYIQIPLKMQGKEGNGELFVYTNKKSLAQKDGNVSALLHLDMEHLGCVDVHVTLHAGQKVNTKFYLADDAALSLVADHIDLLNDRLNKRGYSMRAEFLNRGETTNMMEEILNSERNISAISSYSFDARA